MKKNFFLTRLFIFLIVLGLTSHYFIALRSLPQNIHNSLASTTSDTIEKLKILLEVSCDENEGFCELKKTLSDPPKNSSLPTFSPTILQKYFHYPKFVKIYFLRNDTHLTMQSYIYIADSPPPISVWIFQILWSCILGIVPY